MPPPNPAMAALQAMRAPADPAAAAGPVTPGADPTKDMPMAVDKPTKEIFLDRSLFKDMGVKKGMEITLTGKITTPGASIGFTPSAAAPAGVQQEEQFDPELDTEPGSADTQDDSES